MLYFRLLQAQCFKAAPYERHSPSVTALQAQVSDLEAFRTHSAVSTVSDPSRFIGHVQTA